MRHPQHKAASQRGSFGSKLVPIGHMLSDAQAEQCKTKRTIHATKTENAHHGHDYLSLIGRLEAVERYLLFEKRISRPASEIKTLQVVKRVGRDLGCQALKSLDKKHLSGLLLHVINGLQLFLAQLGSPMPLSDTRNVHNTRQMTTRRIGSGQCRLNSLPLIRSKHVGLGWHKSGQTEDERKTQVIALRFTGTYRKTQRKRVAFANTSTKQQQISL